MARQLTFRLDVVEGVTRESVVAFVTRNSASHLVVHEISEKTHKPHYQGWIWTDVTEQTMKNRIKKQWPAVASTQRGRGTGKYSCAPVRKQTYEAYCLKGTETDLPDIVSGQLPIGYDLESEHRKWWSQYASSSPKKVHIVEEGIAVFSSREWPRDVDIFVKRREVLEWLLDKYSGKGQNSFLMKNYINGILNEVCPEHREEFIRQVVYSERF